MNDAAYWIESLQLEPHPEGGHFRETYRSAEILCRDHLPPRFDGDRAFSTAIYYLLRGSEFSALHRIRQDEVWHHYDGSPLTIHVIKPDGEYMARKLGRDLQAGHEPQIVVKAGHLFGGTVDDANSYALVGCTVAPGFDFRDFEMPSRAELLARYPQHRQVIQRLTRG